MKYFFPIVPAIFALLGGSILLLELLAWASLPDGRREGVDYYAAILGKLLGPRTAGAAVLGMSLLSLGLAGIFHPAFKVERRRVFWGLLGVGLVCMLCLLVAVNYFGLQAGTIWFLSPEFRR
jgi:hypothetical protein